MNELIKITKGDNGENLVSARDLHEFLCIGADFTNWCKRMFEYGFAEGVDYAKIGESVNQYVTKTDYALTMDCAKEISMIQRSEKGKMARQYFISCEKELKQKEISLTPAEMLLKQAQQLVNHERQIKELSLKQAKTEAAVLKIVSNMQTRPEYYCISAFCAVQGIRINNKSAQRIGKIVTAKCKNLGYEIGRVSDEKWGNVGSYPASVLMDVFDSQGYGVNRLVS